MGKDHDTGDKTIVTSIGKYEESGEKNAYILFLSGPLVGKLHPLQEGTTILGRALDIDVPINDNRISRKHVTIVVEKKGTTLTDLGSTNGTYVNGKRIQSYLLKDGDKVQLSSHTIFKFAYQDNLENVFHKELYKMAVIDALTSVFNKRYFLDRLREEFSHAKRIKHPLSLLMIDIDHFKRINDTHGHLAGDCALTHIAKTIKNIVRTADIFARYGGEEFAAILRNTGSPGAWQMAERIRLAVEQSPVHFDFREIPITVSIGVATLGDKEDYNSQKDFLNAADQYLYQSKVGGRNQTTTKDISKK